MHKMGLIEEPQYMVWMRTALSVVATPGGSQWWELTKFLFEVEFVTKVEGFMSDESVEKVPITTFYPWLKLSA